MAMTAVLPITNCIDQHDILTDLKVVCILDLEYCECQREAWFRKFPEVSVPFAGLPIELKPVLSVVQNILMM